MFSRACGGLRRKLSLGRRVEASTGHPRAVRGDMGRIELLDIDRGGDMLRQESSVEKIATRGSLPYLPRHQGTLQDPPEPTKSSARGQPHSRQAATHLLICDGFNVGTPLIAVRRVQTGQSGQSKAKATETYRSPWTTHDDDWDIMLVARIRHIVGLWNVIESGIHTHFM